VTWIGQLWAQRRDGTFANWMLGVTGKSEEEIMAWCRAQVRRATERQVHMGYVATPLVMDLHFLQEDEYPSLAVQLYELMPDGTLQMRRRRALRGR
jgi:hypothetical protein